MKASEIRERLKAYRLAKEALDRMMDQTSALLEHPEPGSVVKHCQTGMIGVIKDRQGEMVLDMHTDAGLRPIGEEELINWDVIQEPQ